MMTRQRSSSTEEIRDFVIAGHGNLEKVKQMLAKDPSLVNAAYQWSETDSETAIQGAAQVGNIKIAEFLLEQGAPLGICTAAMLGRFDEVKHRIDRDPQQASAVGAHSIPLLPHAVWSGNAELVKLVYQRGAISGASLALHNAIVKGNTEIVSWLLENSRPDINSKNYQGKTPLTVATERKDERMIHLLRQHGAMP
jgi:uncharacterized protein